MYVCNVSVCNLSKIAAPAALFIRAGAGAVIASMPRHCQPYDGAALYASCWRVHTVCVQPVQKALAEMYTVSVCYNGRT